MDGQSNSGVELAGGEHDRRRRRRRGRGRVRHTAPAVPLRTEHPRRSGRYLTYHPVLFSQLVLDESLCRGDGYDIPPRLQIPPTTAAPWNTMILRDTCPAPVQPADVEVASNRLVEIQSFCPVDTHRDNTMVIGDDGVRFDVPLRAADRARMDAVVADQHRLAAASVDSAQAWNPNGWISGSRM